VSNNLNNKKMLSLISIQNKKLNNFQKNNIIHLKNEHWKYSISEHNEYLKKNYKIGDFHNLLFFKKKLIGYTGFRNRKFIYRGRKYKYLHFDCLIISKKFRKKKISKMLMKFNEINIKKKSLPSILFCEKKLTNFYKKFDWKLVNKKKIQLNLKLKPTKFIMSNNLKLRLLIK